MKNQANEELSFQRVRIHLSHLTIFDAGNRLWTNRVNVNYRGERDGSEINVVPGPPEQAQEHAVILGQPRQTSQPRVWTRVFNTVGSMF